MSDFPCFDSEISVSGLKFSIHTHLVPAGSAFKISTSVSSSNGAVFSFNTSPGENFSAEELRVQHEKIVEKVPSIFSEKENTDNRNNVDFAALYMKKEFRSGSDIKTKTAENIRKILIFEDE